MKKYLLLFATLFTVMAGFAQTKDSPLELTPGVQGTYTHSDGSYSQVWWKYTATEDCKVKVSVDNGYYWGFVGTTDSDDYWNSGSKNVAAGTTVYIQSTTYDYDGVHAVTLILSDGKGESADNPIVVAADGGTYDNGSDSYSDFYYSYTAEEDGILKISTSGYFYAIVNGGSKQYSTYNNGSYEFKQQVEAGQTYIISIQMYEGKAITFTVEHPTAGAWDMPITLAVGENTIPANVTDGKVWYRMTPTEAGKFTITSSSAQTTDQIIVWDYEYYAKNENESYAAASSEEGSYNVEFTAESNYDELPTFYVLVKRANTPFPGTLNVAHSAFEEGDVKGSAIEATPLPYSATQSATGMKWYKVVVPQNDTNKILRVKATSEVANAKTLFAITYGWGSNIADGNTGADYEVNSQYQDQTLYITVDNQEAGDLAFTISLDEIEAGDSQSNPIALTSGETYSIEKTADRYYTFTGAKDALLNFEVSNAAMSVECVSYSDWYSSSERTVKGNVYMFNSLDGCTQIFKVSGASAGDTFTFAETEYPEGMSKSTAIEVEKTYTFDTTNIWLKHTVKADGMLEISSDVPYEHDENWNYNNITYYTPTNSYGNSVYDWNTNAYKTKFAVSAGDVVYVHAKLVNAYEDKSITFTESEPAPGESAATAIALYNGVSENIPAGSYNWYKFEATTTAYLSAHTVVTNWIGCTKYDDYNDATNDNGYSISWANAGDGTYTADMYTKEGWNYLRLNNYQSDTVVITITGNITGKPEGGDPVLQQTYPQTNTKVTEIPDNIIFMFDQEIASVDAAAIQSGENDPIVIDAEKISIQDGNSVYLNVADVKSEIAPGNVTVYVQLTGVETPYEANFTLGAEFTVESYELTATGGSIKFNANVDFVDYASEGTATVLDAEGAEVTTATLTLDDSAWDVINVEFAQELAAGDYELSIPAATIMSTSTEEYVGGKLPFTVAGEAATFVSVTPEEGSKVDLETEYVVKFSAPVKYTVYMSDISVGLNPFSEDDGAFFSMSEDKTEIHAKLDTESIADWYGATTIEDYISKFGSTVTLHLWKVKDEATDEELEYNDPDDDPQFTFTFKLGDPVLSIEPADGSEVEQLDVVYFSCAEGLEMTGEDKNILVMRNKEQIASIPATDLIAVEAGWFDDDDDDDIFGGSSVTTYFYEFEEPFTEAGTYEVYVPAGTFTLAGANENPVVISTFEIAGEPAGLAADPAPGVVESLSKITLTYNDGDLIYPSYQVACVVTLTDADGNVVASFDQDQLSDAVEFADPDDYWSDPIAVHLELAEPITAPGTYTLNIPYQTFNVGQNFADSPETSFVYTIEAPAETWTKTGYVMPIESWGTDIFWTDACAQEVTVTGTVGSNVIEISQDSYGYHNVITVTANENDGCDAILYNGEAQPGWGYFDFGSSSQQYVYPDWYCYANADQDYGYVTLYGYFDNSDNCYYVDIEWYEGAKEDAEAWKAITGIKNVNADSDSEATYNLAGQRVKASTKGILIKNGRKYLVK